MGWDAWKTSWEEEGEANVNIKYEAARPPHFCDGFLLLILQIVKL